MPTCTRDSFAANSACYRNFSFQMRASIQIYYNSLELAAVGGTSYTLGSGGTLEAAARCLTGLTGNPFVAPSVYYLEIHYNNAVAAGASPASTPATLATAIACNANFSEADLAAQMLHLTCSLGKHTGT